MKTRWTLCTPLQSRSTWPRSTSPTLHYVAVRRVDAAKVDELAAGYDQAVAALRARMRTDLAAAQA